MRVLLLLLLFSFSFTQEPGNKKPRTPADYKSTTLKELVALQPDGESLRDKQERILITRDILPSKVTVKYLGSARDISAERKEIVRQWAMRYAGSMEHYTEPYQTEMLFEENGVSYWLPVQKDSDLANDKFKKGDRLQLHLIRLGASIKNEKYDWVFLVEAAASDTP
jgi:hypothetical protein